MGLTRSHLEIACKGKYVVDTINNNFKTLLLWQQKSMLLLQKTMFMLLM